MSTGPVGRVGLSNPTPWPRLVAEVGLRCANPTYCPSARQASGIDAGSEFEDPTRSGCCRHRQPLPVSRWPAAPSVTRRISQKEPPRTSRDAEAGVVLVAMLANSARRRKAIPPELSAIPPELPARYHRSCAPYHRSCRLDTSGVARHTSGAWPDTTGATGDCFPPRALALAMTPAWGVTESASPGLAPIWLLLPSGCAARTHPAYHSPRSGLRQAPAHKSS